MTKTPKIMTQFRKPDGIAKAILCVKDISIPMTLADPDQPDCPLIFANEAFERLTGFSNEFVKGKNCRFLQRAQTNMVEAARIRDAVNKRTGCDAVLTNYKADGTAFHNLITIKPIKLRDDKCLFVGCQFEFKINTRMQQIREGSFNTDEKLQYLRKKIDDIATLQRETMNMRASAAVMRVQDYLRTISLPPT